MAAPNVLVVGGGIAGSTLAVLLARRGVTTTLVERAGEQRSSGGPVDVRGAAVRVVARMNLLEPVRAVATRVTRLALVDDVGGVIGWIPTQASADAIEIGRRDLASILVDAARDHVEIIYGDTVEGLDDDGAGVEVRFQRADARRFDLVVGADGVHSHVRQLAFGPERHFTTFLGMHIVTVALETTAIDPNTVYLRSAPGRAALIHPTTGQEGGAFIFRHPSPQPAGEDGHRGHLVELLTTGYGTMAWRVPELLAALERADDVYVDSVNRVSVERWARGRVVLVGDAAGCVTLFGEGSSMAIVGAASLAEAVVEAGELSEALRWYQQTHEKRVARRVRGTALTSHLLVPSTRVGITLRSIGFRIWPAVAERGRR